MATDIGTVYVKVAPNMTGIQGKIAAGFKGIGSALINQISDEVSKTKSPLGNFFSGLKGAASDIGKVISDELINPMVAGIANMGNKIATGFKTIGGKMADFISPVTSRISSAFSKMGDSIYNIMLPIGAKIGSVFTKIGNDIMGFVSPIANKITGLFSKAADGVGNAFTPIISKIGAVFSKIGSNIDSFLSPITSRISATFRGIANAISTNLSGTIGPLMSYLGSKVSAGLGALGGIAAKAGKGIAIGLAAGAAGIATLTGKMLMQNAELEQQIGGSEAVFGEYAKTIQEKAATAFKTAGLSQQEFLQGANKMGSLFQGAGFNVQQSMQMSSDAMQRASDIASIMGISTTEALDAVTGMAKGNFTMMDNLGVAMNDTSLNAYALEKGLGKTTEQMSIQEKVGLANQLFLEKTAKYAGNYAKENETLSGSINTTKKAFDNFLSGGGDMGDFIDSLINTIKIAVPQILKILPKIVTGLAQLITELTPIIAESLPVLLPAIIQAAISLMNSLILQLPMILQMLVTSLITQLPILLNGVVQLFIGILQALPDMIKIIVEAIPTIIDSIVTALTNPEALTAMIMGAIELFMAIILAIPTIIIALVDALPTIIDNIVTTLTSPEFIAAMFNAAVELMKGLIKGIGGMLVSVGTAAWEIVTKIGEQLSPENLAKVGGDMVKGLWNGIKDLSSWILDKVKGFGKGIVDGIKKFFGIKSPSTVFAGVGENLGLGLAKGLDSSTGVVSGAVDRMADDALSAINKPLVSAEVAFGGANGITAGGNVSNKTNQTVTIGNITLGDSSAVQEFFKQLNRDTINIGMGLTPIQGAQ